MIGIETLITVAISYLSKSKTVEKIQDAAEEAIKSKVRDAYGKLKDKMFERLGMDTEIQPTIERLESEPESTEHQAKLTEEVKKASPQSDPEVKALADQLETLLKQSPAASQLTIRQNVSGDKNIIIGQGDLNAGDISFG